LVDDLEHLDQFVAGVDEQFARCMSAYSQKRTFAGVEILSAQGLESTQGGRS